MITIVTQHELAILEHKLFVRFPNQLLQLIAGNSGCRERQLITWMHSWLPMAPEIADVRTWVSSSLDWFLDNGDIQKEPGGRYTCVPAYSVTSGDEYPCQAHLNGDPSIEDQIRCHDIHIHYHPRYINCSGTDGPATGIERTFQFNQQQHNALKKHGLHFIDGHELEKVLPRIDRLEAPDVCTARNISLPAGVWQVYNPQHPGVEGWQPWRYGDINTSPIVRWLPKHDQKFGREARYFYCYYGSQVIPLSYEQAILWQFRLEAEFTPRSVRWHEHDQMLWLPLGLPSSFWQWLNLLARRPPDRNGNYYRLHLDKSAVTRVKQVLQEHLGLHYTDSA